VIVFVTGANGLVGSYIVKELLQLGYRSRILVRENSNTDLIKDEILSCEVVFGDVLDSMSLEKNIAGCEAVIHCAALVSFDSRRKKEIYNVNVEGTSNIVNACLKVGVRKIVFISSIAALGRSSLSKTIDESSKWEDSSSNSAYAKSKYLAELEVFRAGEEGLDFTILNPSVIIGPGDVNKSSTKLFRFIKKMPWFYPNGNINVVDVRDVARVSCNMLRVKHANRLVLNSQVLSYQVFYKYILQNAGIRPLFSIQLPTLSLYLLAYWSIIRSVFIKSEPLVTIENCRHLGKNFKYKSEFYNSLFDVKFISAEESISYTINSLAKN